MTTIYKICDQALWSKAKAAGRLVGAPVDLRDGFIHFSTAAQLAGTAAKHFSGATNLVLLAVDSDALGAELKWEVSRGGELFPHLYAPLPLDAVLSVIALDDEIDGQRPLPELIA